MLLWCNLANFVTDIIPVFMFPFARLTDPVIFQSICSNFVNYLWTRSQINCWCPPSKWENWNLSPHWPGDIFVQIVKPIYLKTKLAVDALPASEKIEIPHWPGDGLRSFFGFPPPHLVWHSIYLRWKLIYSPSFLQLSHPGPPPVSLDPLSWLMAQF